MSLPASRIVSITVNLTPNGIGVPDLSSLMIFGSTMGVIDVTERFRDYSNLEDVANDFGTTAPEYLAASLYFGVTPKPSNLKIAYWAASNTGGRLYGGPMTPTQQLASNFTAITDGALAAAINGHLYSINGMDFSTCQSISDVAAVLNTALRAEPGVGNIVTASFNEGTQSIEVLGNFGNVSLNFFDVPTATGTIIFSVNPVNNSTITLNGTVVTFKTSPINPLDVQIGVSTAVTLASLLAILTGSSDTQLVKFGYSVNLNTGVLYLNAAATGPGGNALTIAASVATPSASTLLGGNGTDVSALLLLGSGEGGSVVPQQAAESALSAFVLVENMTSFYGSMFASSAIENSDYLAIAQYVEGDAVPHIFGVTSQEAAAITTADTSSIGYLLKQLGYNRSPCQYSSTNPYAYASIFGRMLTVNYAASNSVLIVAFGVEVGVTPEQLTSAQANALDSNNYSYYAAFSNSANILVNGTMPSGVFFDTIQGTDNLAIALQTAIFNLLTITRVPQTDGGNNSLGTTISGVLQQYVENGFLAPGVWNASGFGKIVQGQFLPLGFYVFIPAIATQSQATRARRISVPIQIAAKGSGAVQSVNIAINFNA